MKVALAHLIMIRAFAAASLVAATYATAMAQTSSAPVILPGAVTMAGTVSIGELSASVANPQAPQMQQEVEQYPGPSMEPLSKEMLETLPVAPEPNAGVAGHIPFRQINGFTGITAGSEGGGLTPDQGLAVHDNIVAEIVNASLQFFKSDGTPLTNPIPLRQFFLAEQQVGGITMRPIFAATAVVAGLGLSTFGALPTEAAVFGVGPSTDGFVSTNVCMDVFNNNPSPGTEVIAFDCHAGPNQQFQFAENTIYAKSAQVCLQVLLPGQIPPGLPVQTAVCDPTSFQQQFRYSDGQIQVLFPNPPGPLCVDATNMANLTQLVANTCNGSDSQHWEIKAAIFGVGPPTDGFVSTNVCMDVEGNVLDLGTPVIAFDCHAGPNQQFQFAGQLIYAMAAQRCLTITEDLTAISSTCDEASPFQQFFFQGGQIRGVLHPELCLDAGNMQNLTQLVLAPCNPQSSSQHWEIK